MWLLLLLLLRQWRVLLRQWRRLRRPVLRRRRWRRRGRHDPHERDAREELPRVHIRRHAQLAVRELLGERVAAEREPPQPRRADPRVVGVAGQAALAQQLARREPRPRDDDAPLGGAARGRCAPAARPAVHEIHKDVRDLRRGGREHRRLVEHARPVAGTVAVAVLEPARRAALTRLPARRKHRLAADDNAKLRLEARRRARRAPALRHVRDEVRRNAQHVARGLGPAVGGVRAARVRDTEVVRLAALGDELCRLALRARGVPQQLERE